MPTELQVGALRPCSPPQPCSHVCTLQSLHGHLMVQGPDSHTLGALGAQTELCLQIPWAPRHLYGLHTPSQPSGISNLAPA